MAVKERGDPRLESLFGLDELRSRDVRPVVKTGRKGPSGWIIAIAAGAAALLLFMLLEARRVAPSEPSVRPRAADSAAFPSQPPPLYIPPGLASRQPLEPQVVERTAGQGVAQTSPAPEVRIIEAPRSQPEVVYMPAPVTEPAQNPLTTPRSPSGAALVIDKTAPITQEPGEVAASSGPPAARILGDRIRASPLANRSSTVAQGMLIPAVLETAFDSTRPGLARAIVSRDVRGFDGTKVLIPRGSRLVGEYGAQVSPGQKRALITWTRLVRPDGMAIAIGSPTGDTLGRGGVRAKVDTHFLERFTAAFLRTTLDVSAALATRVATRSIYVGWPGMVPTANTGASDQIMPTLKVPAATSITIFVARDLEFPDPKAP